MSVCGGDLYVTAAIGINGDISENAQVYYTEIHGNTALVSVKADLTIVSWNEQNRILSVVFDGEVEEDALKVAKSVTRIK